MNCGSYGGNGDIILFVSSKYRNSQRDMLQPPGLRGKYQV